MAQFKLTASDGTKLHCCSYPVTYPLATIYFVHGLGEHSGRYGHVIEHFNQAGFHIETFDLRGHGQSEGRRGQTPCYDMLMDDLGHVLENSADKVVGKRVVYGHSFGGNLVLNYVLKNHSTTNERTYITPDLLLLTSPMLRPGTPPPGWKLMLGKIMYKLWPTFSFDNGIDPADLTSDQDIVGEYSKDPLNHSSVSARLGISLMRQGLWVLDNANLLSIPTLLMHGDQDRLTSFPASEVFAKRAGSICQFRAWPGMKHELHNEIGKKAVLDAMTAWLAGHLE